VKRIGGLHKRWILNTVMVVFALGMLCVIIVTAVFSAYYHTSVQADLRYRAETTTDFFADYGNLDYSTYYQSCINYAKTFEDRNKIELQFISASGRLVASSYGNWTGQAPVTSDIQLAMDTRAPQPFIGKDEWTGERIIAVSSPIIYSNGQVIGVLRYVTSTRLLDWQILKVFLYSITILALVMLVVLLSSGYYIRTILVPVRQITKKAHKIANGTYGIQIQTKYNDEIGELASAINEMSTQINQNEVMQREFISSLSHELRTPLTAITGWSETLLSDENMDADTRRGMTIIQREARRLTEMVVSLLDFNRIQDGRMTLNMCQADLRGEFEDIVYMYSSRLKQENIQLEYLDDDEEIPEITCDPERLRQVFLNILDNAAKHGGEGGRIEASIRRQQGRLVVQIRDFGPGIPEDELSLVKRKFYKGSSKARGTGIGLAVCDEIVAMHGGDLILENAPGGGTLVTVSLPISQ